ASSPPPKKDAVFKGTTPLGMGRSGRSSLSIFKSKTSLRTTPPAYIQTEAKINNSKFAMRSCDRDTPAAKIPAMAAPAIISAAAVGKLGGRIKIKQPLKTDAFLDDFIPINFWLLSS